MVLLHKASKAGTASKPVICPKCDRGKLAHIPEWSDAKPSRRGRPPPDKPGEFVELKCWVCGSLWSLTIE